MNFSNVNLVIPLSFLKAPPTPAAEEAGLQRPHHAGAQQSLAEAQEKGEVMTSPFNISHLSRRFFAHKPHPSTSGARTDTEALKRGGNKALVGVDSLRAS